jgi:4-amino-4-deoxy-L-arabinose transferase-like glycosyltransferase
LNTDFGKNFWLLWWFSLFLKLGLTALVPLAPDEAYYWVWSQKLQLSYYDHPAMVAWLLSPFSALSSVEGLIRIPILIMGHLTYLIWAFVLKEFKIKRYIEWLWIALLTPLLGIGSLAVTPDVPLLFFWSLSFLFFIRALNTQSWYFYALLGLSLGLGFCSKYMIVLFIPSIVLCLLYSGTWRKVKWSYTIVTITFGLIACTPVVLWNYWNEWVSFEFQLKHGFKSNDWSFKIVLEYLGGQLGLILPVFIIDLFTRNKNENQKILFSFAAFPLLFFLYSSFKAFVEGNWPLTAYPALYVLSLTKASTKRVKIGTIIWASALALLCIQIIFEPLDIKKEHIKIFESYKFNAVVNDFEDYKNSELQIFASSYQMASVLSLKRPGIVYKLKGLNRIDFFDFQKEAIPSLPIIGVYIQVNHRVPKEYLKTYKITEDRRIDEKYRFVKLEQI